MGVGDQNSEEDQKPESSSAGVGKEVSQSENGDRTEVGSHDQNESSGSKVPPPRPAPPLTPASSISKPDTPPETPTKQQGKDETTDVTAAKADGETDSKKDSESVAGTENSEVSDKKDKLDDKLEEVTEKAKQWGSMLSITIYNIVVQIRFDFDS